MANAPDDTIVTGSVFQQKSINQLLVTPNGGTQGQLSAMLNGGTVVTTTNGSTLSLFGSITPAGSNLATATQVTAITTQLGTAASTTGVYLPASGNVVGRSLLMLNTGTAAVNIYGQGGDTIDTIAGTTGVVLTNAQRCFFTATASGTYVSGPKGGTSS